MSESKNTFNEWAMVELFGHNKIVGKVSEATLAGGAFLRVDVPSFNGAAAFTRFYGPSAIYSISPVTEDIARGLMEHYRNEPVSRFELPQLAEKTSEEPQVQKHFGTVTPQPEHPVLDTAGLNENPCVAPPPDQSPQQPARPVNDDVPF